MWYKKAYNYTFTSGNYDESWTKDEVARLFDIRGTGEIVSLDVKIPDNNSAIMILMDGYYYKIQGDSNSLTIHFVNKFPTSDTYVYHNHRGQAVVLDMKTYNVTLSRTLYLAYRPDTFTYYREYNNDCFIVGDFKFKNNFAIYILGNGVSTATNDKTAGYYLCVNLFRNYSDSSYLL